MRDCGYLADPAGVELLPGAASALAAIRARGVMLVLVSNQSGIARGIVARSEHEGVHARFVERLAAEGTELDAVYYCPHGPTDGCACRKPRPGMLRAAELEHGIDLASSMMVGDKPTDVAAGNAAGCATALLAEHGEADVVARDWPALLPRVLERFS